MKQENSEIGKKVLTDRLDHVTKQEVLVLATTLRYTDWNTKFDY